MAAKMTAEQVAAKMRQHLTAARKAAEIALYQGGSIVMTEAKKRAPVDFGTLKGSGYVTLPRRQGGETIVEVGFGGAAKAYAKRQHEELSYRHEVGEAKYLENAISHTEAEVRAWVKRVAENALSSGYPPVRPPSLHVKHPDDGEKPNGAE